MNIIYISGSKIPSRTANSIQVMKMCQAFMQEGHNITLLVQKTCDQNIDCSLLWQHYGIKTPFPIKFISVPGHKNQFLKNIIFIIKSVNYIRNEEPSLIYTRLLPAGALISHLHLPFIYESHAFEYQKRLSPLYIRSIFKGKKFLRLVVITNALRNTILENFGALLRPDQIVVAPDGVDLEQFKNLPGARDFKKELGILESTFTVGYSGHLYPGRGIDMIIQLAVRLPEILFLIMGGNDEEINRYREYIHIHNIANIRIIGYVPNYELPKYLAKCEVLLMPHQRKVEVAGGGGDISLWTSPMKMFEYMATGRLIISSDLSVLREVLNVNNAVLCDPEDVDTWQQMIIRAKNEQVWRDKLATQAAKDVVKYDWRQRARHVLYGITL